LSPRDVLLPPGLEAIDPMGGRLMGDHRGLEEAMAEGRLGYTPGHHVHGHGNTRHLISWHAGKEGTQRVILGETKWDRKRLPLAYNDRHIERRQTSMGHTPTSRSSHRSARSHSVTSAASGGVWPSPLLGGSPQLSGHHLLPPGSRRSSGVNSVSVSSARPDLESLMRLPPVPASHKRLGSHTSHGSQQHSNAHLRTGTTWGPTTRNESRPDDRPITPRALRRLRERLDSRGCSVAPRQSSHAQNLNEFARTL